MSFFLGKHCENKHSFLASSVSSLDSRLEMCLKCAQGQFQCRRAHRPDFDRFRPAFGGLSDRSFPIPCLLRERHRSQAAHSVQLAKALLGEIRALLKPSDHRVCIAIARTTVAVSRGAPPPHLAHHAPNRSKIFVGVCNVSIRRKKETRFHEHNHLTTTDRLNKRRTHNHEKIKVHYFLNPSRKEYA